MKLFYNLSGTGHEKVTASVETMKPIPAGANPFHHDSENMGTDLVRGWIIMHRGFDNKDEPRSLDWIHLINTRTGQRIKVVLKHDVPESLVAKIRRFASFHYWGLVHQKDRLKWRIRDWKESRKWKLKHAATLASENGRE